MDSAGARKQWDSLRDEYRGKDDWFASSLYPLIAAAEDTALERLSPFTSVARLCFDGEGAVFPFADLKPAHIHIFPQQVYQVFAVGPYESGLAPQDALAVETADPARAIVAVMMLLRLGEP